MHSPLVSVIMPAYNADRFIEESINSLISQTYTNWELIIINDGSIDNTQAIAGKFAAADERIIVIKQSNKKAAAARNTGIAHAKGEWIAFLDADDLWVDNKLEKQLQLAFSNPNIGVVFTAGYSYYQADKLNLPYLIIEGLSSAADMYTLEYQGNYIPILSVIVKKTHVDTVGLQDESSSVAGCEDWDYWIRLALAGVTFYGMPDKLFYYRRHNTNVSNNQVLMLYAEANVLIKNFRPQFFNRPQIAALVNAIAITICRLIQSGKISEALLLNKGLRTISNSGLTRLSSFLINTFKRQSYYLVRSVFKMNRLLYNHPGNA
jgi:teichuronic acid biosynthesis glycosyltransferase TuaG